jgi:glyoxylase-like metal-dependent hydrolase (beta-lactamase superfamily II)
MRPNSSAAPSATPPPNIFTENNGKGLAKRTFKDRMTIGSGADQIDLYYFGAGHTNGDAIVVFRALRTAHLGDLFARKGVPLVDGANGGTLLHYFETVNKVYSGVQNVDTVITGHSDTTMTWADVKDFANFTEDFLHSAEAALKAGKTPEQAAAEWKLPDKYKDKGFSGEVAATLGGLPGRYKVLAEEIKKK